VGRVRGWNLKERTERGGGGKSNSIDWGSPILITGQKTKREGRERGASGKLETRSRHGKGKPDRDQPRNGGR